MRSAAEIRAHAAASTDKVFTPANLSKVGYVGLGFLIVGAVGVALIGWRVAPFLIGLPFVFALAFTARFLAGNGLFIDWGIEYVIFALGSGCSSPTPSARRSGSSPRCRPSSSSRPASSSSALR